MNRRPCRALLFCIAAVLTLLCSSAALAGNLDSLGAPTSTAGHMPTLQELYDYLTTGAVPGAAHVFQEPAAGPTAGTMKSLHDIYTDSKALFDQSTVTAADVRSSKKFFSTSPWGIQTGTMPEGTNVTGGNGLLTFSLPSGYYAGKTATATDGNLASGNIKSGVSIFGVTGTAVGATGNATVNDVRLGKTFSNSTGSGLTGNLAGGVSCTCPGGSSPLGRWCDNNNGTVTDTTNGLVWLKDASWGGAKLWVDSSTWDDAQTRAGTLSSGTAGLTDGSVVGDWRLPTKTELVNLANGTEAIRWTSMHMFTVVQWAWYWSSTTSVDNTNFAWDVCLGNGFEYIDVKSTTYYYVWPVRAGQ